jgi:hypothetical protein
MEQFKVFQAYITLENQFQIFVFEKKKLPTQTTQLQKKKNDILGYNF